MVDPSGVFRSERVFAAPPARVFAAFARADELARWWGPAGFRNTFETCDFVPGGRWVFVMHGPDGTDYPNESVFRAIEPDARVVIDHVCPPHFTLTVTLAADPGGTRLTWVQAFASASFAAQVRHIIEPANEQNLDRLAAVLAAGPG